MSKQALGKGLSALISTDDDTPTEGQSSINALPLNLLVPGSSQPRNHFEENNLLELAESIKKNGVLQPILVRKKKDANSYEIIAGERRFRAAKLAGLQTIPVIIKDLDDKQSLEVAIIENIQRENLTAIEESEAYKRLQEEFNYTQEQLSSVLGKSRSHIANMLRLLVLPQEVKDMINSGIISMVHARVLAGVNDPQLLAEKIVAEGLNVREAEKLANGILNASKKNDGSNGNKLKTKIKNDPDLKRLETQIADSIGLFVEIKSKAKGGEIKIKFSKTDELSNLLKKLNIEDL